KFGRSAAVALYGVLMDQILIVILIPLLLFLGIFFEIIPSQYGLVGEASMILIYVMLLVHAGILCYGVLVNPAALKIFLKKLFKFRFLKRFRNKVYEEADYLEDSSRELRKKPFSFLVKAFLYSMLAWMLRASIPTIVILSLLPANELLSFLRSVAMHLAFMVVPTPGGSGGIEGLFAIFQGPLIDREAFIGLAVFAWRIIGYYITIAMGMMAASWYVNKKVVQVTNG
ncbi:MAG: lysylphosphatidylglycerol synthase transmembrane domain-containing protein, partial [Balneolaceae bacterium]